MSRRDGARSKASIPRSAGISVVVALTLGAGVLATAPAAGADPTLAPADSSPAGAGGDAGLVLQIAQLTDQLQAAQERVAADQVHRALDQLQYVRSQHVLRSEAVDAYISGGKTAMMTFFLPSPVPHYYTDLVLNNQENTVDAFRRDQAQVDRDAQYDQADLSMLATLNTELDKQRAALEARSAFDAALTIQQQEAQARAAALAEEQRRQQQQIDAAASGIGTEPVPTAVNATLSEQQAASQYPLGPLSASQLGSHGLAETGQTVAGVASWYGPGFDGRTTASGAIYDENGWTCASPDLPFGTLLLVTAGSASVLVEVNDRGPYVAGRVLDLSHAAAQAIGSTGLINVVAYVVAPS